MKKIISILIATLIIMSTMTVIATASNSETTEYVYTDNDITYTFEFSNSNISADKQEAIARKLIGSEQDDVQTHGLGCTLFGHDLVNTTASYITHNASPYAPKCLKKTYDVNYCEDCDYIEETFLASSYIHCCS